MEGVAGLDVSVEAVMGVWSMGREVVGARGILSVFLSCVVEAALELCVVEREEMVGRGILCRFQVAPSCVFDRGLLVSGE